MCVDVWCAVSPLRNAHVTASIKLSTVLVFARILCVELNSFRLDKRVGGEFSHHSCTKGFSRLLKFKAGIQSYLSHSPQRLSRGASEDGVGVGEGVEDEIDGGFADVVAAESRSRLLRRRLGVGLGQVLQGAQDSRENVHLDRLSGRDWKEMFGTVVQSGIIITD